MSAGAGAGGKVRGGRGARGRRGRSRSRGSGGGRGLVRDALEPPPQPPPPPSGPPRLGLRHAGRSLPSSLPSCLPPRPPPRSTSAAGPGGRAALALSFPGGRPRAGGGGRSAGRCGAPAGRPAASSARAEQVRGGERESGPPWPCPGKPAPFARPPCRVEALGGRQKGTAGIPVRCQLSPPPRPPRLRVSSWGGGCFARLSPRGQGRWELTLAPAASCQFLFSTGWAPSRLLFYFRLATWSRDSLRRSLSGLETRCVAVWLV